jgi:2-polyprenyl-3-methyl-5-hydroxy-6-metoxy-1,4-benzoquinol methylase
MRSASQACDHHLGEEQGTRRKTVHVEGSAYDAIAEWYDPWLGSASVADDAVFPAVEYLMGVVEGLRVCDLACGHGCVARHLADRGARVTGIEVSVRLLEMARGYEAQQPRSIDYRHDDARALNSCTAEDFDVVVLNVAHGYCRPCAAYTACFARVVGSSSPCCTRASTP